MTAGPRATARVGALLGERLGPGDVIALSGELGTGKTVLVRGIAEGAGVPPSAVRSPTFTLVHRYRGGRLLLVHADAYRLAGARALYEIGLEDVLDPQAATVVEWAPRVDSALPGERLEIRLEHAGRRRRRLEFRPRGARAEALSRSLCSALRALGLAVRPT